MDADDRLRDGLERNATSFAPDVAVALLRVQRRRRTTVRLRSVAAIAASLVAIAALAIVAQRSEEGSPTPAPIVPADPATAIEDRRFEATVPAAVDADAPELAGRWQIRFDHDGNVVVESPERLDEVVTGQVGAIVGHELVTDLFMPELCSGHPAGRYHWSIAPWGDLNLAVVEDTCRSRVELLAGPGRVWTAPTPIPTPSTAP